MAGVNRNLLDYRHVPRPGTFCAEGMTDDAIRTLLTKLTNVC